MKVSFLKRISRKQMSFLIFLSCTLLLCFALYLEIAEGLDPCPLCSLQRACMALGGGLALIASLHNPGRIGFLGYVVFQILFFFDWLGARRQANLFTKPTARFGSLLWPRFGLSSGYIPLFRGSTHDYF